MHRYTIAVCAALSAFSLHAAEFSGARAMEQTRRAVEFGPRPPGSPAIRKLQQHILGQLRLCGCKIFPDNFVAETPNGPVRMINIIARFAGTSGKAIVISGHYDTKVMPGAPFVGANDGGSSTGFLLEMARALSGQPREDDVYLVWFDGEEAFAQWSSTDGIYGSRHLAKRWAADGTARRIKALINVDMIGDAGLGILEETNSTAWLRRLVWETAQRMGHGRYFLNWGGAIEDDHVPFLRIGVPALDLIDFDYGPNNQFWHTPLDTMDKLSANSLDVVGKVMVQVVKELEARK